jgi:hypothetical protein
VSTVVIASPSTVVNHPTASALPISADTDPCPIDWDQEGLQAILPAWKKAYQLRALRRNKPGKSLTKISEELNTEFGEKISDEAWRKRIKSVTRTVYLVTGM